MQGDLEPAPVMEHYVPMMMCEEKKQMETAPLDFNRFLNLCFFSHFGMTGTWDDDICCMPAGNIQFKLEGVARGRSGGLQKNDTKSE